VAESVDQSLPEGLKRKQRLVNPFEDPRLHPAGDREMPSQEEQSLLQKLKAVPLELALIEKFRLVRTLEAGHPELALREGRKEPAAKCDHCRVEETPFYPKANRSRISAGSAPEASGIRPEEIPRRAVRRISSSSRSWMRYPSARWFSQRC
jgi:hypothetical protein